jgi:hypothetical protein
MTGPVFQFSRGIYRELAPYAIPAARRDVLVACEASMQRLANDRLYFARPARRLFADVRHCFPLCEHERVWRVVSTYVAAAESYLDSVPYGEDGEPTRCPATTRGGTPCRREPLPRNGYCPSHQHLAGTHGHGSLAA